MSWAKARTTEFPAVVDRPGRHRRGRRALIVVSALAVVAIIGAGAAAPLIAPIVSGPDTPLRADAATTPAPTTAGPTTPGPAPTATSRRSPTAPATASSPTTKAQPTPSRHVVATPMPGLENAVLTLTNQARAASHCGPLRMDSHLLTAARLHSADMADNDYFSHDSQDGRDPAQRMTAAGYDVRGGWAENIAAGYPTPQAVMDGWMGSRPHRANIENCALHAIGIGVARGPNGWLYWTQDFGGR